MGAERVLSEIAALGFSATELGPKGFLPEDATARRRLLARHDLRLVGGFVPAVLHREEATERELAAVDEAARGLAEGGASVLVLAVATGRDGYEAGLELGDAEWAVLARSLGRVGEVARRHGLEPTVHPHYGTVVEKAHHVDRLLAASDVGICLDIGHLAVAGADPLEVARRAEGRVRHVHLKDVDAALAARVRDRTLGYHEAVKRGLYVPLGRGAGRVGEVVRRLEAGGYDGWYVFEQDTVLDAEPPPGRGPIEAATESLAFLRGLA
ncbi:MAG TPA: sugar phosphate isomerase/epimerase [Vicinamibacteria bacterium]|nr:sugar phosphate isomerase/epimerase [Vicinamibacteria bacterium]